MINDERKLAQFLPRLSAAEWIALDTEADSLHSYPEKLCLLQVSLPGADELVDPLAPVDLSGLWTVLRGRELILHGADYDLRLMHRGFEFVPQRVFDTMLAARFLGLREFGLTHLVEQHLGVQLEKGPQKANWARRPLTERMRLYAQNDTRYLNPLADLLKEQLEHKGRLAWHREACGRLVAECAQEHPRDPDQTWRVRGSEPLNRNQLGVLRELWRWREAEARRASKPPYFILSHEMLVTLARSASLQGFGALLPMRFPARRRTGLRQAWERGFSLTPDECPALLRPTFRRVSETEQRRFSDLKTRRDCCAEELGLDPTFIASRASLLDLACIEARKSEELMAWQRELLGLGD